MKRSALTHPFLFTLASILFLYIRVTSYILPPQEIIRSLLALWILLVLLIFPVYKISKNWDVTGIFLTLFVFVFYCVKNFFLLFSFASIITIIIWGVYLKIKKRNISIKDVTLILNLLSIAFVLGGSLKMASLLSVVPSSYFQKIRERAPIISATSRQTNPNIYYIILDGYPRLDVLENLFGYDNSSFTNYLQTQNFIIPSNNHSNYPKTFLSVSSTLNMDYIQNITPDLEESYFWWLMSPLINHSQTRMMLEEIGYTSVSLNADWTITDNKTTDIYFQISPIQISEFEIFLLANTSLKIFGNMLDKIAYMPRSQSTHREIVLYDFETLSNLEGLPEPYFLYAHIISPHPPFVFDKDGNSISPNKTFSFSDGSNFINQMDGEKRDEAYREGYIQQVQFVNSQLIKVIDNILQSSETPPIIILLADHGSGLATDFTSSENTCAYERFSPFAAFYLPEIDKTAIPDDISSVNLFRIIFNEYFETEFPLLENYHYFAEDLYYVYKFDEISPARLNVPCQIQP